MIGNEMVRNISNIHDQGLNGGMLADINKIDWVELGEGVKFKLLRYCDVTGNWVLYVQLQPGVKFGRHQHFSPAEFLTKGLLTFETGEAGPGVYGYESIGEIHEEAAGLEVTEFIYFGHGPVSFIDKDDKVQFIADLALYKNAWEGNLPNDIVDHAAKG